MRSHHLTPAILQGGHPLEHPIPSEHLDARWGSGGLGETATDYRVRADDARKHRAVH